MNINKIVPKIFPKTKDDILKMIDKTIEKQKAELIDFNMFSDTSIIDS